MTNNSIQSTDNLDQIRQIIFGEEMKNYKDKLNNVFKEIESLKSEMKNSLLKLEKFIENKNEDSKSATNDIAGMVEQSRKEYQKKLDELQKNIDQLLSDKTDKSKLADLLIEVGQRVKGEGK